MGQKKLKHWTTKSGYKIFRLLSGRSNVFLLSNSDKNIVIDTSPKRKWKALEKRLRNLSIDRVDYLILTHSHYDHADNARRLKDNYKALIIIHKEEAVYLESGEILLPHGSTLVTRFMVNKLAKRLAPKFAGEPCSYDILVDEKLDLKDFGFNAYIMHTPGHTPGSMSVIVDDEVAIVGDTMFGVFKGSVFPPFANDVRQIVESWGKLLATNCSVFLPSHGSENSRALVQKDYNNRKV